MPGLLNTFRKMDLENVDGREQHTFLGRYIMDTDGQFSAVVLPSLKVSQQDIVLAPFRAYLKQRDIIG